MKEKIKNVIRVILVIVVIITIIFLIYVYKVSSIKCYEEYEKNSYDVIIDNNTKSPWFGEFSYSIIDDNLEYVKFINSKNFIFPSKDYGDEFFNNNSLLILSNEHNGQLGYSISSINRENHTIKIFIKMHQAKRSNYVNNKRNSIYNSNNKRYKIC